MLSILGRYKELIVCFALLVYPFATFLARGRGDREPNFIDRGILAVTGPLQKGICWAIDGMGGGWHAYVALRGTERQNEALKKENAELRNQNAALAEQRFENERLRRMLTYGESKPLLRIPARVIATNPVATILSVRIDRGEADGVRRGMPVVTPDGVVGRVERASGSYADVLLINDAKSKIGVRIQRSRARGTATGAGGDRSLKLENDGALILENVLRGEDVLDSDLVVTSGTDSIFPPGLTVGKIGAVRQKKTGMFLQAEVLPAVDLNKVEEVWVLGTGGGMQGQGSVP